MAIDGDFSYTSLNDSRNEFRLLFPIAKAEPDPAKASKSSIVVVPDLNLEFELRTVSLDEKPKYTALSYVWGEKLSSKPIRVNGKSFIVTDNLYCALQNLQYSDIAPAIWIDAICINQSDYGEKSLQVTKMGEIYSGTTSMIIWLGPKTEHSDLLAAVLHEYPDRLQRFYNLTNPDRDDLINVLSDDNSEYAASAIWDPLLRSLVEDSDDWNWDNFLIESVDLMCRMKWWSRIWVVQEFVLAPECNFQVGLRKIGVDQLILLVTSYISHIAAPAIYQFKLKMMPKLLTKKNRSLDFDWPMHLFIFRDRGVRNDFSLYNLLCQTYCRPPNIEQDHLLGATDKRDYVYGLYALVPNDFKKLEIHVDYTKSWQDLFIDVAYRLIRAGHLDVLALCQWTPKYRELPRWTPTWPRIEYPNVWFNVDIGGYALFSTSSTRKVQCELLSPEYNKLGQLVHFLRMRGFLVDEVTEVMSVYPRSTAPHAKRQFYRQHIYGKLFRDVEYLCRRSKELAPARYVPSVLEAARWKMLVWDHEAHVETGGVQRGTSITLKNFMKCLPLFRAVEANSQAQIHAEKAKATTINRFAKLYNWLCALYCRLQSSWFFFTFQNSSSTWIGRQWSWVQALPRWICATPPPDPLWELDGHQGVQTTAFMLYIEGGTPIRPFITASGYIGIGPGNTEPGDAVCVLDGGHIPYVLRPRRDMPRGYDFQGGAYVHGVMDGEFAIENQEPVHFDLL